MHLDSHARFQDSDWGPAAVPSLATDEQNKGKKGEGVGFFIRKKKEEWGKHLSIAVGQVHRTRSHNPVHVHGRTGYSRRQALPSLR